MLLRFTKHIAQPGYSNKQEKGECHTNPGENPVKINSELRKFLTISHLTTLTNGVNNSYIALSGRFRSLCPLGRGGANPLARSPSLTRGDPLFGGISDGKQIQGRNCGSIPVGDCGIQYKLQRRRTVSE